ncbi:DUF3048 domain-containing protein [Salinibacillus xinjiangensis]|uniref:DUF3048 domain-containing protein n=2 Tax=Salinibacillus xinjiangensis TaxID=1229268 RepID=A0A6G1X8Y3_9BACI|nr:DUF3048 domain-containing protein [Salinibacillus xinjiangensis]
MILLSMMILLVACKDEEASNQKDTEQDEPAMNLDQEPAAESEEPEDELIHTYPLTGIKTDEEINNRIVGVMVNNHNKARPQTGLSQADIVYELLAEGPITRFIAFFHSETPEMVGPVRSAREYYADLALGMDSIYVYHGAAQHIEDIILNKGAEVLRGMVHDNDGFLFKRESFRQAPHNSYLLYPNVYEAAENKGISTEKEYEPYPFLSENEVEELSGDEASKVHIVYDDVYEKVTYEYDEANEKYIRYSDGEKSVELETDEPIMLDNIFIVETGHQVIDSANRRAIDLESGGKGYLIQKGIVKEVNWKNVDGRILPFNGEEPVEFVPGKTWVNVVPESPGMDQSVQFN